MPRPSQLNIGRAIGALGSSVPGVGDIGTMAFIKKKAGTPIGIGAKQGLKFAGGPIAVASWSIMAYQNRKGIQDASSRFTQQFSLGLYQAPDSAWDNSPKNRGVKFDSRTERKGRFGDGPPSLSPRTRKSPRFGKKRRRCKHRNKAGKQCLRPAGHSGRHRYR